MARVHLLSAVPAARASAAVPDSHLELVQIRAAALADRFGVHEAVDEPGEADLILFVERSVHAGRYFRAVRRHRLYREHRERCYLHCSADRVLPLLPGIYTSVERRSHHPAWSRSGGYPLVRERGAYMRYDPRAPAIRLFSFVGRAASHPVRRRILELAHPDAELRDTAVEVLGEGTSAGSGGSPAELDHASRDARLEAYVRSIRASSFVLCPRGEGPSSFRLFQAMLLGRAPVIVSDQWVPPEGPDWDRFSLRVSEGRVEEIPALLERRAPDAPAMGAAARAAWLEWFAEDAYFHRTVEWCLALARHAATRRGPRRYAPYRNLLRPAHAGRWVKELLGY